jgi:hypothetical protein
MFQLPEGVENAINPRYFINIAADQKPDDVPFLPSFFFRIFPRMSGQNSFSSFDSVSHMTCMPQRRKSPSFRPGARLTRCGSCPGARLALIRFGGQVNYAV